MYHPFRVLYYITFLDFFLFSDFDKTNLSKHKRDYKVYNKTSNENQRKINFEEFLLVSICRTNLARRLNKIQILNLQVISICFIKNRIKFLINEFRKG